MMELVYDPRKGVWAEEPSSLEKLHRNFFGELKEKGKLFLEPEEALYALALQNGVCRSGKKTLGFNDLASDYMARVPRLFIRYNCYRDWRDRGLVVKPFDKRKKGSIKRIKPYPGKALRPRKLKDGALWYPDSMFAVLEDEKLGRELFEKYWFGQFGVYKQERGNFLALNFLETIFLVKYFGLVVRDASGRKLTHRQLLAQAIKVREWTRQLYGVYEEWRLNSFIVKTGFKFGSHFRIYFPGAGPTGEYVHSKHVLHVFPKEQKLLISEWARAVRVAHGVKKTFLLAVPRLKKKEMVKCPLDFLAYRRKKEAGGWVRETPREKPRYLLVALSEDEHMGGLELGSLLETAKQMGLELILSISDRETSITYYILKEITLPGKSKHSYYEIEWFRP